MAPISAGRGRMVLCWQSRAVLVWGHSELTASHPPCPALPQAPGPRPVFLAGVTTIFRGSGKKCPFALSGVDRHFSGIFQAFLFGCSAFGPATSRLYLHFPLPISSTNMKLGRSRCEGEGVGVAPRKGFSALSQNNEL